MTTDIEALKHPSDVWAPIFRTGVIGGREWTHADLAAMVHNWRILGATGKIIAPIRPGHDLLLGAHESAQPALGLITDVKVEGDRLLARMSKVEPYAKQLARSRPTARGTTIRRSPRTAAT